MSISVQADTRPAPSATAFLNPQNRLTDLPPALLPTLEATARHLATVLPPAVSATIADGIASVHSARLAERRLHTGQIAPDFALPDATGTLVRLTDLLAKGPVILVFFRGNWCPYCDVQLRAYQQALSAFTESGATLVAISPQTPENTARTATEKDLRFPVLSDAGNTVARRYGLAYQVGNKVYDALHSVGIDLEAANGNATGELPLTATFVIRPDRSVAWAEAHADFTRRTEPAVILAALTV